MVKIDSPIRNRMMAKPTTADGYCLRLVKNPFTFVIIVHPCANLDPRVNYGVDNVQQEHGCSQQITVDYRFPYNYGSIVEADRFLSRRPKPGQLNTVSKIVAPTHCPINAKAKPVMIGGSVGRRM